jgi:hypothetical protein
MAEGTGRTAETTQDVVLGTAEGLPGPVFRAPVPGPNLPGPNLPGPSYVRTFHRLMRRALALAGRLP